VVVWRNELDCQWRSLDNVETAGLAALVAGSPFEEICECMMAVNYDTVTATDAAIKLRQWVEQGLLKKGDRYV
jgi:hypothetical protein